MRELRKKMKTGRIVLQPAILEIHRNLVMISSRVDATDLFKVYVDLNFLYMNQVGGNRFPISPAVGSRAYDREIENKAQLIMALPVNMNCYVLRDIIVEKGPQKRRWTFAVPKKYAHDPIDNAVAAKLLTWTGNYWESAL